VTWLPTLWAWPLWRAVQGSAARPCTDRAVVVGPVTVGDDATIGAIATVVRDVAAGAVMLAPVAVARPRASS
jgi:bifunctional N-acetylglucosamine-1-phosphate-uridyltransferase/glucosamine-1-phosphate-acetyltransferase GlmU-like protein